MENERVTGANAGSTPRCLLRPKPLLPDQSDRIC